MDLHVYHHFPEELGDESPWNQKRTRGLLRMIYHQGEQIMAQLDDLKAAQAATNTRLDALQAEAAEILADIAAVIARLNELPPSQDLTEVIAEAQAISDRVEAVRSGLDSRPPSPTPPAQG